MNKFTKIAVSFLLIISIVFNPLGSMFDVRADAFILEIAAPIIAGLAIGATAGLIASVTNELILMYGDDVKTGLLNAETEFNNYINDAFQSGNTILVSSTYYTDLMNDKVEYYVGEAYVNPDLGLTGVELEIAQAIADGINEKVAAGADISLIADKNPVNGALNVNAETYEVLKEIVVEEMTKEYNNYVNENISNLTSVWAEEDFDSGFYDFSFVGPQLPSFTMPTVNGTTTLLRDGFVYKPPVSKTYKGTMYNDVERLFDSESACRAAGFDVVVEKDGGWQGNWTVDVSYYALESYVIYNDKIYFKTGGYFSNNIIAPGAKKSGDFPTSSTLSKWVSVDGSTLANTDFTVGSVYKWGFYYNSTGEVKSATPISEVIITEEDFTTTTGGGSIELPRTEEEELIGNAMGLGLVSPDALIEIGTDGSITSIDGITISKLQELCDLMADGNLAFEDIQQYLQVMTQLIQTGNFTEAEQITLLENINANVKSIEDVNTSIKQLVDIFTVGDTAVSSPTFEDVTITSGGFDEAYELIEVALPVVNQSVDLIGNLFNWNDNPQTPPNFSFYWDSNKDGETEKYTVLDLSFMEQTLTNSNLEDKGRFVNPMTIREFIQSLIVLITYSVFAIKVLRKIPSLIGGAEGAADDVATVDLTYKYSK